MASDNEVVSANINLVSLVNVPLYINCIHHSVASQLPCVSFFQGGGAEEASSLTTSLPNLPPPPSRTG